MSRAGLLWLLLLGCTPVNRRLDPGPFDLEPAVEEGVSAEARAWRLRARVAEERGELDEAERAWSWVLRLERTEPASWVGWGRYLERANRSAEAARAYETALERDPEYAPAHLYLGDLLVRGGHERVAAGHLEAALRGGEDEAWAVLARLYQRMDDAEALADLVARWLAAEVESPDDRLHRARAALAAGRAAAAVDDLALVLAERDDPLVGELLVEAAVRGCRLGAAWETSRRLGLREDPAYARAIERLAAAVAAPTPVPAEEQALVDRALRMLAEGRAADAQALLAAGREKGFSERLWLVRALALAADGHVGPALDALDRVASEAVLPQVHRRYTDRDQAPLVDQAGELADHLRLDAGERPEDPAPSAALRLAVRDGVRAEGSPRVQTALYLDAGRVDEAVAAASTPEARLLLAAARPDLLRADPPACDGPALAALAAELPPCEALPWLERAWQAAPLLSDLDLSAARDACDAAPSPE